ncbi:MAG: SRPBCC family protein [Actinomycetota bacterium]
MSAMPLPSDELVREIDIDAPPETVFEYLTDPVKLARWWGLDPEIDPRPGGIYRVRFLGGRVTASGEVKEIIPGRRLVHTWGWEGEWSPIAPGASTVEITLTPRGAGTHLELRHSGLRDTAEFHRTGWDHYLARLGTATTGADPGPDPGPPGLAPE